MNYKHFIGIDVSKNWLDFTVLKENQTVFYKRTENTVTAIKNLFKELKKLSFYQETDSLVCMEHTGIYNNFLMSYLEKTGANVCLESGLHIKQSSGIKRGKNDKVDSARIAMYAYKNQDDLKIWEPKRPVIERLNHLTALRSRLTNVLKQLKTPIKEAARFMNKKDLVMVSACCKRSVETIEKDLRKVDDELKSIIKSDPELTRLFSLASSVTGVGPVTAIEMIITTNEFKSITCAKKYACYSGVAPFEHQSGSSIKGKTRVSSLGNKNVKKLLHLAALSASICAGDMKIYFERKVTEGKNKMSVLNAIRNKIIARVFACVRNNRIYQKNYNNFLVNP